MTELPPAVCPGLESLEQFCRDGTPADVAEHVIRCSRCRRQVAEMLHNDRMLARLAGRAARDAGPPSG